MLTGSGGSRDGRMLRACTSGDTSTTGGYRSLPCQYSSIHIVCTSAIIGGSEG